MNMSSLSKRGLGRALIACALCLGVSAGAQAGEERIQLAQKADLGELREMRLALEAGNGRTAPDWSLWSFDSVIISLDKRQVGSRRNVKPGDSIPINLGRGLEVALNTPIDIELIFSGLRVKSAQPPGPGSMKLGFRWGFEGAAQGSGGAMVSTASPPIVSEEELKWRKGWELAKDAAKKKDDGVASSYVYSEPIVLKKQIRIIPDEKTRLEFEFSN